MGNEEDIRKLLQNKFQDFEPEPDRDIWAGIERAVRPVPLYKKMGWYGYAAAAVVLLLLTIGIGITDILYRQPGLPARSVAAGDPAPVVKEDVGPLKSQATTTEAARPVRQTQNVAANPAATGSEEHPANANAIDAQNHERTPAQLLSITPLKEKLPDVETEIVAQEIKSIEPAPVLAAAKEEVEGDRRRIDLDGLSLEDALSLAGNGLKKLATKPEKVLTSQDGTETIKTYRINFLDISFSKKTHTIKSTKEET